MCIPWHGNRPLDIWTFTDWVHHRIHVVCSSTRSPFERKGTVMKRHYFTSYSRNSVLDKESVLKLLAVIFLVLAFVSTGSTQISLIIGSILLLAIMRIANLIEDVSYIGTYRISEKAKEGKLVSQ
jgi:hypothetical protein